MIRGRHILFCLLLLAPFLTVGQSLDTLFSIPVQSRPFTLPDFYTLILENHPVAKQAALLPEAAQQEIRLARGSFDPKLELQVRDKQLNGREYYNMVNGSLKFPTILPFDPVIGIDRNRGDYVNPERYINDEFGYHQVYTGLSLPLGRGLITDERRATLRQAELLKDMSDAEKISVINKLLLEASKTYWDWCYAHYNLKLMDRSVGIAAEIFRRTKNNFSFGEASLVDTVQAHLTFQQRAVERQEALRDLENAAIHLSTLLWDKEGEPLDVEASLMPVLIPDRWMMTPEQLGDLIESARVNHPDLRKLDVKLQQLEIDRRLATEFLKPEVTLSYYALNQPIRPDGALSFDPSRNHKLGVDVSFPLFLRKERSKLALTRLKISNMRYEQSLKERQIINNLNVTYSQLSNLQLILANQRSMVSSYERLLQAELLNLEQGESDLFKINVQQEKLIQAQTKWLKLLAENEKLKAYLYWAAGDFAI